MSKSEEQPSGKRTTHLLVILTLCYAVSFVATEGALRGLGDWFLVAAKPPWAPPLWLYVPLWTVLYGVLGLGLWGVWESSEGPRKTAVVLFVFQALLSAVWPWLFFAHRLLLVSSVEGLATVLLMALTFFAFARVRLSAALLLIPFWIWSALLTALAYLLSKGSR